jgi:hypothetical protein
VTKPAESPFILTVKPSKLLGGMVIAAHGLAIAASLANAMPSLYQSILIAGLVVHLFHTVKQLNNGLPTVKYADESGWQIADGNEFESVVILKSTVVTTFAIWLHVRPRAETGFFAVNKKAILIVRDALDEEDYRGLIVKLRTSAADQA